MHISLVKGILEKWGQSAGNTRFLFSVIMGYCIPVSATCEGESYGGCQLPPYHHEGSQF